ncbi:MAG: hypothetical protein WEB37_00330 [Bacteroidota bacterium]
MIETLAQRIQTLERHLAAQPRSPLFAQLAGYYLEAGRSQDALTVCDTGLANYPFYTTGHLIKGKTLLALNMRAEARREFEFVHQMLPLNEAVGQLVAQIPPSPEESLTETSRATPTVEASAITTEVVQKVEPAIAEADQLLSQFTEEAEHPTVEEPALKAETQPQEESPSFEELTAETFQASEAPAETADSFGLTPPPSDSAVQETFAASEPAPQVSEASAQIAEAFASYAEQKRGEMFGLENSMSLEEYLSEGVPPSPDQGPFSEEVAPAVTPEEPASQETVSADPFAALTEYADSAEPATPIESSSTSTEPADDPFAQTSQDNFADAEPKDQIEEIAEKLKEARKITPVINLSDRSSATPSEADTPSETGFVTPTLAEIYAKQGWYDDAIKAYKTLAINKPADREKYESRISELEELKKQQSGT